MFEAVGRPTPLLPNPVTRRISGIMERIHEFALRSPYKKTILMLHFEKPDSTPLLGTTSRYLGKAMIYWDLKTLPESS